MVLINNGDNFPISFRGKNYDVPTGRFEVTQELGNYLIKKSKMWDKKLFVEDKNKLKGEQLIHQEIQDVKTESKKEEDSEVKDDKEKVDTNKVLEDAEEFLKG